MGSLKTSRSKVSPISGVTTPLALKGQTLMANLNNASADLNNAIETATGLTPVDTGNNVDNTVFVTVDSTGVGGLKQESRVLDFDKLNFGLDLNPRLASAYTLENNGWMGRSLHTYGQQEPFLVSKRADGSYWTLRGFLRGNGINHVRKTGIPATKGKEGLPAIPADPNFMAKVNVLVMTGLSRQQEIDLIMDHGTKTGLSDTEKYTSAKIMQQNGFSRGLIAAKLNMTVGNFNNGIGRILSLPSVVEENFLSDKPVVKISQDSLKLLKPAYDADQKSPNAKIKVGGEAFNAAWEKLVADGPAKRTKVMSRDNITAVAEVTLNADIRDILQAIRDDDGKGLASAIMRVELSIQLTTTTNSGYKRVEEGIETSHGDFNRVD